MYWIVALPISDFQAQILKVFLEVRKIVLSRIFIFYRPLLRNQYCETEYHRKERIAERVYPVVNIE